MFFNQNENNEVKITFRPGMCIVLKKEKKIKKRKKYKNKHIIREKWKISRKEIQFPLDDGSLWLWM